MRARLTCAAAIALLTVVALAACTNDPSSPTVADDAVPDFALEDLNPNSPTSNRVVAVRDYLGDASGWYFAQATSDYCRTQFGWLDQIQTELDAESHPVPIHILGVNAAGQESGNAQACAGRDLPWLQDTTTIDAWGDWNVIAQDVVILDRHQAIYVTYNLAANDLSNVTNRDQLKTYLRNAAAVP